MCPLNRVTQIIEKRLAWSASGHMPLQLFTKFAIERAIEILREICKNLLALRRARHRRTDGLIRTIWMAGG